MASSGMPWLRAASANSCPVMPSPGSASRPGALMSSSRTPSRYRQRAGYGAVVPSAAGEHTDRTCHAHPRGAVMDDPALDRLRSELSEVKDQLAATSDVLTAIGRSASDVDGVLGTVVDSARQLCHADVAQIHLVEEGILVLARSSGLSEAGVEYMARHPMGPDRQSLIGRVQLYGTVQQI